MISRRQFLKWFAGLGLSGAALAGYGFLVEPLRWPAITRYQVNPGPWPAGLTLKIAVIADIHACNPWMTDERIRSIVATTNGLGADLIVLLGDYSAGHHWVLGSVDSLDWSASLAELRAPLGVHAILGNHDWWDDRAAQAAGTGPTYGRLALERVGIPVYENDVVHLTKDGQTFWLAGLGDQLAFLPSRHRLPGRRLGVDDLAATMAKIPPLEPVILLAHEPDIMAQVPDRVALVLSGHTHGGQVRILGWSPIVPSRYRNRYAYGHVREQCDLIVSGGLGCSIVPFRFGVPPEIVVVTVGGAAATT
ncbi:metallophosphoesterase [Rhodopseudomonas sp. NSM]|uniref:metallophosphoesterase n=1 Tax=Rhodopseudomonas sp. NSM TaxID=3457630 RepID=UPI0040357322